MCLMQLNNARLAGEKNRELISENFLPTLLCEDNAGFVFNFSYNIQKAHLSCYVYMVS